MKVTSNQTQDSRKKLIKESIPEIKKLVENDKTISKTVNSDRFKSDFDLIFKN
jgi:archaellum biogenesis ATPase FlaH